MATALYSSLNMSSFNNQCGDPDMEAFLDFSAMPSPSTSTAKLPVSTAPSNLTSPATTIMPLDQAEDLQTPAKPSHEYERWKQQTGLPTNSVAGLQSLNQQSQAGFPQMFSNSGLDFDDMGLMGSSSKEESWSSGVDMTSDMNMDLDLSMPSFYLPSNCSYSPSDDFIDPSAIASPEEPKANIRVWPGMHQQQAQQAALAKAQAQAQAQAKAQHRQQLIQQQQKQLEQQRQQQSRVANSRRSASHQPTDPRVEETISRVVNQIRRSSAMNAQADNGSSSPSMPHIVKMKKDEEDMDEDERLLASEEGKKLSSKERRQLRNKVSARAFRSRRKEYIGQLEGEVAMKASECNELRTQNRALMEENARSRAFIEKLLRHQAFKPFLEDLSRDETLNGKLPTPPSSLSTPTPVTSQPKDVSPFSPASRQSFQEPAQENPQIGMALVPETQLDMSMLNINNGNNWSMPPMTYFQQVPQVFVITELPEGPTSPINTEMLSGKGYDYLVSDNEDTYDAPEEIKADYPVIEKPNVTAAECESPESVAQSEVDDEDPLFTLYRDCPAPKSTLSSPSSTIAVPEKAKPHFELVISGATDEELSERLERMMARMAPVLQRIDARTAHLEM